MVLVENTTGLARNNSRRFDAVPHKTSQTTIITSDEYSGGQALQSYNLPTGTVIMDVGPFPEGELSGLYAMRTFWTGSDLGTVELRVRVYEDDVNIYTSNFSYTPLTMNVGSTSTFIADPRFSYRFTLEVGDLDNSNIVVDYIQFDQLYHAGSQRGRVYCYDKGDGTPVASIPVEEEGYLTITGTGSRSATGVVTFASGFINPPLVVALSDNSSLLPSASPTTSSGTLFTLNHVDGSNWSSEQHVHWLARGFVESPFTPGETDVAYY